MQLAGGINKQVSITWNHSVHGKQNIMLNIYNNPQVQNGITFNTELYEDEASHGLMVSSVPAKKYEISSLKSTKLNCNNKKVLKR
jgi:hypothetical protein